MKSFRIFALALLTTLFVVSGIAFAAPLPIINQSFEADVVVGDGNTATFADDAPAGAPSGWNTSIGGWLTRKPGSFFNDKIAATPDPADNATEQLVWSNGGSYLNQVLSSMLAANTKYTLMVDIGDRNDTPFGGADLRLGTGGGIGNDLLTPTSSSMPTPADGDWATWTLEYVTGAAPPNLGQFLRIELHSNGVQTQFDNVRLDAELVPEPGTLGSFSLALCVLAAARVLRSRGRTKRASQLQ